MMRIVFFDKKRETYISVGDVVQLDNILIKSNGRYTSFWGIVKLDGNKETFKQKDYTIHRIEI